MVISDRDSSYPPFDQLFIKFGQGIFLLPDKILQFLDMLHLNGFYRFIRIRLLLQFPQVVDFPGNVIIGCSSSFSLTVRAEQAELEPSNLPAHRQTMDLQPWLFQSDVL